MFKWIRRLMRPKGNFKRISGHMYKVYNQNGLNNALYDYFNVDDGEGYSGGYTKERVRKMLENWPKKYPCKIIIVDQSFECARVYLETIY